MQSYMKIAESAGLVRVVTLRLAYMLSCAYFAMAFMQIMRVRVGFAPTFSRCPSDFHHSLCCWCLAKFWNSMWGQSRFHIVFKWSCEFPVVTNRKMLALKVTSVWAVIHTSLHYGQQTTFCQHKFMKIPWRTQINHYTQTTIPVLTTFKLIE